MNIQEALDMTDRMKPNMMLRDMKIRYLQELDQKIYEEILLTHEHTAAEEVLPVYDDDSDPGTELLAPDKYAMVYAYWLMSKVDLQNLEMDKFNNDRALYEHAYNELFDWWNRTKMPVSRNRQLWI